jgi:hypothetical protein
MSPRRLTSTFLVTFHIDPSVLLPNVLPNEVAECSDLNESGFMSVSVSEGLSISMLVVNWGECTSEFIRRYSKTMTSVINVLSIIEFWHLEVI